jgi:Kef-type K+ transport system membrane component KefB
MSHGTAAKGWGTRAVQAGALLVLVGLLFVSTRFFPSSSERGQTILAVGFLLLAGTLTSELVEVIGLPHLTGYLVAGAIAGPHVLHLVSHHAVEQMAFVNSLALALIALAGGLELKTEDLIRGAKSLSIALVFQCVLVFAGMTLCFFLLGRFIPFVAALPRSAALAVSILWGVISITRSPSAVLGILAQTRATGPVASFTLAFVMASDIVVVVSFAAALILAKNLIDPTAQFSSAELWELGRELLGSVALGTTMGIVIAAYMRLIGQQLIVLLLVLGLGAYEVIRYLQFDALLTFMVAGFVVQNLSRQGPALTHAIEQTSGVVFVIFFATAGAHLNLPLVAQLWPVALALGTTRAVITVIANRVGANVAGDPPVLRTWGWSGLVSQAGLTLGLVVLAEKAFPAFGADFRALGVAAVALNELIGPVIFKLALDRTGESSKAPAAVRPSLTSEPVLEGDDGVG